MLSSDQAFRLGIPYRWQDRHSMHQPVELLLGNAQSFGWDYIDTKTFNIHDIDEKFLEKDGNLLPGIDEKSLDSLINDLALNTVYLEEYEIHMKTLKIG